jgi:hypothetical protein
MKLQTCWSKIKIKADEIQRDNFVAGTDGEITGSINTKISPIWRT